MKLLFELILFVFNFGEKVGLIGVNGVGKLMLFFVLCGELYLDVGDFLMLLLWWIVYVL